jgi:F420-dependent oxidoreductase-like protein
MTSRALITVVALTLTTLGLASSAAAQNGYSFSDAARAASAYSRATVRPQMACRDLLGMTDPDMSIVSADIIPGADGVPEHCRVTRLLAPEIRFQVNLPASWNRRFYMNGNGGFAGESPEAPNRAALRAAALRHGFVSATTNTGHDAVQEPLATFGERSYGRQGRPNPTAVPLSTSGALRRFGQHRRRRQLRLYRSPLRGEPTMRFGLFTSMGMQTWSGVLELWQHLEKTGWDIACVTDHFFPNTKEREGAMLESWSTLSALAALVPRMRVGTIVLGNTYRHPAVVAKMSAQVDIISGGRLLLGLGAGWQQNEHEGYGIPFYTMKERLERLDEACQVMRSLWTERRSNFKGQYYQLSDAPLDPKPVQSPHPELMIGGGGERVTLRIVARHADHWNVWGGSQVVARKGKILDEHCASVGRDPKTITRSVNMALLITDKTAEIEALAKTIETRMGRHAADARDTCLAGTPDQIREQLQQLKANGASVLFIPSLFRPLPELRRDLDRFIAEIAPAFR